MTLPSDYFDHTKLDKQVFLVEDPQYAVSAVLNSFWQPFDISTMQVWVD